MFDFIKAKLGGSKLGNQAQVALEKAVLNSPTIKKIEREFEAGQAAERARLLAELAALDQEEAKVMGDLATKLKAFAAEWRQREAELQRFSAEWVGTAQVSAGLSHQFQRRRALLLRQIAELLPDGIEAAAAELENRWRAYAIAATQHELHDYDRFRDCDAAYRAIVREVRDLAICPVEKIGERLLALTKRAEKLLAASPPRHAPVDPHAISFGSRSDDPRYASCSLPQNQGGNW